MLEPAKEERVGLGDGETEAAEMEEEGEPVRLSLLTLFRLLLSPTWIIGFLLPRCPSVNLLKIVLGFLARVVRANPVREQVTIIMSSLTPKKVSPNLNATL